MAQTQDSRILIKRDTNTGVVPTVPTSNDHLDGSWIKSDIYVGEAFINTTDKRMWIRTTGGIIELESLMLSQKGAHRFAIASGTNTYTASLSPTLTAYASGNPFHIKFSNANTGTSTLNIDSLGAKNIYLNGAALSSGAINANAIYLCVYDGTQFHLVGTGSSSTQWTDVAYNSGDYTTTGFGNSWTVDSGDLSYYRYMVDGKTMYLKIKIDGSTTGGAPTQLRIALPAGYTIKGDFSFLCMYEDAGTAKILEVKSSAGLTYIAIIGFSDSINIGTNNQNFKFSIFFEIE